MCDLENSRYKEYNFKAFEYEKKKIQPTQIASLLGKYKLKAKPIRVGEIVKRGYEGAELRKVFSRYIPEAQPQADEKFLPFPDFVVPDVTTLQSSCGAVSIGFEGVTSDGDVTSQKC